MDIKNIFNKKNAKKYFGPKETNKRLLTQQNLIFLASAIMIILVLTVVMVSSLSFFIRKINASFQYNKTPNAGVAQFETKGFDMIKDKIPSYVSSATPTPSFSPTLSPEATSSPIITPIVTATPILIPSISSTIAPKSSPNIKSSSSPTPKITSTLTPIIP